MALFFGSFSFVAYFKVDRESEGFAGREVDDMQQHFWARFKTRTSHFHGALCASTNTDCVLLTKNVEKVIIFLHNTESYLGLLLLSEHKFSGCCVTCFLTQDIIQ